MEYNDKLLAFIVRRQDRNITNESTTDEKRARFLEDSFLHGERVLRPSPNFPLEVHNKQVMEVESVLLDLIKPLIFMSKYFLPFQNVMKYDPVAKCVVSKNGSFRRKTMSILWILLVVYRLVFKLIPSCSSESASISTAAYAMFIVFNLGWFHYYWTRTSNCCDIFNHVLSLAERFHVKHRSPPKIQCINCAVHFAWIYSALYVTITVILYMVQLFSPTKSGVGVGRFLHLNRSSEPGVPKAARYEFDVTEIATGHNYHVVLEIASTIGSFVTIFYWTMSYWHFGIWALFFRKLLVLFYWRIETKREFGGVIVFPKEIRTYNKIVSIMDEYNGISGVVNVLSAIVVVVYVSTSVKHAFSNFLDIFQIGAGLHLVLSYVPLTFVALWLADVERVAGLFAGILKEEYARFSKECGDPAESLCGISMVHYDLSTSNIGFKGFGFYTVSYKFITTIVGAIITYSVLVLQLSPRDQNTSNSLEP